MKSRILLFVKLPPPYTGAIMINKFVTESRILKEKYNLNVIPISYKNDSTDLGSYSLRKFILVIVIWFKLISSLVFFKPCFVYFQISPLGVAFYRDFFFVITIKIFKTKILYHIHGQGINESIENHNFKKKIYKFAFKNSSVICLSEKLLSDIKRVYDKNPFIVNNGIPDVPNNHRNRKSIDIPKILFISNLFYSKGIADFLDSLEILVSKGLNLKAIIIGGEAELTKDGLQSMIKKKMLSNHVKFLGPIFSEKKIEIFNEIDILVHPTHIDAFPLILLEAMRAQIPVISTFVGAIPDIVDNGITGFLVEKNKPRQLANKIDLLVKDRDLRIKMGKAGRKKFLEKYTIEIFENNIKNVFDKVL